MLKKDIKKKVIEIVSDMSLDSYEGVSISGIYSFIFNDLASLYSLNRMDNDEYKFGKIGNDGPFFSKKNKYIDFIPTIEKMAEIFVGIKFQMRSNDTFIVSDGIIIKAYISETGGHYTIDTLSVGVSEENEKKLDVIKDMIVSSFVIKDSINEENSYRIAYRGQYSIETTVCKFNEWKSNIAGNYNDDIPYDEINRVIRADKAGLIMFYGVPGTGKTSLVKSLINDNRDTNFIFIDTSVCESISDGLFLEFLQENKNSVIVFEDCEKLLYNREDVANDSIGTILNLTDGIIAESMKIKFICTFNCSLAKIDPALLRKGRLSLKYEFKELSLDKTKAIYPEATKPMTLAEAHNVHEKNDFSEKKVRKIGF